MAGSWPRLIRDPVHDLIRFENNELDRLLLDLIHCREFQRLRRIKQLGFADFVFPGATHNRFAHSIGVMWNAKRFLNGLYSLDRGLVDELHRTVIIVAALLHDVGHGPFSHAFEKIIGTKHEKRTVEIILDPSTEIHDKLSRFNEVDNLPERVAWLFPEGFELLRDRDPRYECPEHLTAIVSSQFDADRADYLIRDSHFCGTEYGRFDLSWLLDHLHVDTDNKRLYLSRKTHQPIEEYVFARYHMYQSVYFHKTTRSAEVMLRLLLSRFTELLNAAPETTRRTLVPDAPASLVRVLGGSGSLGDFLLLDDHTITEFLKACALAADDTLRYLASGILNRRLYKCIDATDVSRSKPGSIGEFHARVTQSIQEDPNGLPVDAGCAFVNDTPSDTPYRIYDPDAENPATQIYVELDTGEVRELSQISDIVDALRRKISLLRYYFPEEFRDRIDPIAQEFLGKVTP